MKACLQKILPQHFISTMLGKLANARMGKITQFAIKKFIKCYQVNMIEAKIENAHDFQTFNAFFTRALKDNARPICHDKNILISPVDGRISEIGLIQKNKLLQAKNNFFNLKDLCGGDIALEAKFQDGNFLTAYLSPKDYHRI
ncbi:MAG TPA: phosphatidylserine decarboxylase, partial [Acinetobacter lwoffii]|nr:phosphatidylserine decarboxylase [Acinetobacter lwoffii]